MDKNKMSKAEILSLAIREIGGVPAVESALAEIAHKEGDEAVARIADEMSATDIAQVTLEGDIVKPSVLHAVVTPEAFRKVFRRVGAKWGYPDEDDDGYWIRQRQDELQQFFCAFILLIEDAKRRNELLQVILTEPYGTNSILFSVIHEKDFPEYVRSGLHDGSVGDWRELLGLLRSFPEEWQQFQNTAVGIRSSDDYSDFIQEVVTDIYNVAVEEGGVVKSSEQTAGEDIFTPLP